MLQYSKCCVQLHDGALALLSPNWEEEFLGRQFFMLFCYFQLCVIFFHYPWQSISRSLNKRWRNTLHAARSWMFNNRDFKIQDATTSRTQWLINGLGLERRRLSGKSKVKIPVWMQGNAAAKRSLSVWFFCISFAEIAMASFKKVHEMLCSVCLCLIEEIIVEEDFTKHTGRVIFLSLTRRMKSYRSRIKTQPNLKPISEWKGVFLCFLTQ